MLSGDLEYLLQAALQRQFTNRRVGSIFVDDASVTINARPWVSGDNHARLHDAGFGVQWRGPASWLVSGYLATRIGDTPALVGDASNARLWIRINKAL